MGCAMKRTEIKLEVWNTVVQLRNGSDVLEDEFSNIFPRTGRRLIGRYKEGCSGVRMTDDF